MAHMCLASGRGNFARSGTPAESESLGEEDNPMHPGMFFWHGRRGAACGSQGEWQNAHFGAGGGGGDEFGGGSFGVRRPLRFLAYKLDLDEAQVSELAAILNELKTERAQAEVDHRRTTTTFADAVAADSFDDAKARSAADDRVKSAERVQTAVSRALGRIHALLKPEQRAKLAYLLRTGALSM